MNLFSLSLLTFLPLIGMLVICAVPARRATTIRWVALVTTVFTFILSAGVVLRYTELPIDVHLMVEHPETQIEAFAEAGANIITIHVEADRHAHRTLQRIHSLGCRAGVVINPGTPALMAEPLLEMCDIILVMSVNPGAGGQKFIPAILPKLRALRQWAQERGLTYEIEVDGGINPETARLCKEAGADVLVAGNSVFSAADPAQMVRLLREG